MNEMKQACVAGKLQHMPVFLVINEAIFLYRMLQNQLPSSYILKMSQKQGNGMDKPR